MSAGVSRPHPAAIVVENSVPLFGVLVLGWSVGPVMVVYWVENGLRGLETAARMLLSRATGGGPVPPGASALIGSDLLARLTDLHDEPESTSPTSEPSSPGLAARLAMTAFFLVHYGIFWVVHGVFVFVLFVKQPFGGPFGGPMARDLGDSASLPTGEIVLAAAVIGGTILAAIVRDSVRTDDRVGPSTGLLIARAYGRMILLHVTLLVGGFALMLLGSPTPAIVLLIALKLAAELFGRRLLDGSPRTA